MKQLLFKEVEEQKNRGVLLVLTGATGVGKDTVLNSLQFKKPSIIKIVTTTSRTIRKNESEGNPYYFLSHEEFKKRVEDGAFFEWTEFRGDLYGTRKETLEKALSAGTDVVWRIDVRGVINIKEKIKQLTDRAVFVFLTASFDVLIERVKEEEGEEGFLRRWNEALVRWEMENYGVCDYLVANENGKLEQTTSEIIAIIQAKRLEILNI
jgi:guanylate kinase